MGNELLTGFLAGQSENGGNNGGNGGAFRLLGRTCPAPDNARASINGTAPAAPAV